MLLSGFSTLPLLSGCRISQPEVPSLPSIAVPEIEFTPEEPHQTPVAADFRSANFGNEVLQASFQPPPNDPSGAERSDLPPPFDLQADPLVTDPIGEQPAEEIATPELRLRDVLRAVEESYPLLAEATINRQIAAGRNMSAWGNFDTRLESFTINQPEGFYENYRAGISLEQPMYGGGYLFGGYRVGNGFFQPWYKERETNDGGEFAAGVGLPLLKNRLIDQRRAAVNQTDLEMQAVEPAIRRQWIQFTQSASRTYWHWVAARLSLDVQQELLELAQARVENIDERIAADDLAPIARINNQQLIALRETILIQAERRLQEQAIRLSLFFRTPDGRPLIPAPSLTPRSFPSDALPGELNLADSIQQALASSPEIAELDLRAQQIRIDLAQAENAMLPQLDARVLASQDVGGAASALRDKSPFELEAGLYGEVPLQRRGARGAIDVARGRLSQIAVNRQFVLERTTADVQDAISEIEAAQGRIERATANRDLSLEALELARFQFEQGDVNLIELNIYEQAAADAQIILIGAQADFFAALADYRAALAINPREIE